MVRLPGEREQRRKRRLGPRLKKFIIFKEQAEGKPVKEVRKDICNAYYQNINIQIIKRTATINIKGNTQQKKKKISKVHREKIHRRPE